MARAEVDRALKKQRLLRESAELRSELARNLHGVTPAVHAVDGARRGWDWLKAHPAVPVAVVVCLVVVKPALIWRVGRGALMGWQLWRQYRHLLVAPPAGGADVRNA